MTRLNFILAHKCIITCKQFKSNSVSLKTGAGWQASGWWIDRVLSVQSEYKSKYAFNLWTWAEIIRNNRVQRIKSNEWVMLTGDSRRGFCVSVCVCCVWISEEEAGNQNRRMTNQAEKRNVHRSWMCNGWITHTQLLSAQSKLKGTWCRKLFRHVRQTGAIRFYYTWNNSPINIYREENLMKININSLRCLQVCWGDKALSNMPKEPTSSVLYVYSCRNWTFESKGTFPNAFGK